MFVAVSDVGMFWDFAVTLSCFKLFSVVLIVQVEDVDMMKITKKKEKRPSSSIYLLLYLEQWLKRGMPIPIGMQILPCVMLTLTS